MMDSKDFLFLVSVSQLLSCATTLCSQESANLGLPDFPVDNLPPAIKVLVSVQKIPLQWGMMYTSVLTWVVAKKK